MCIMIACFTIFFFCVCLIGACSDMGCACCREEYRVIGAVPVPKRKTKKRKLKLYSAKGLFAHRCKHAPNNAALRLDIPSLHQQKIFNDIEAPNQQPIPNVIITTASIETETTEFSSESTPPPTTHKEFSSRRLLFKI